MVARVPLAGPVLAGLAFGVLLVAVLAGWAPLDRWDAAVSQVAREYGAAHPGWVRLQLVVTATGQTVVYLAAGAVTALVLVARRAYPAATLVAVALVTVPVLWGAGHALLPRPRPVAGFVTVTSNGFPSGHTAHATAVALVAVLLAWPAATRPVRALVLAAAVGFAGLVGVSRVALLAHWPSDVLGGWLLVLAAVPLAYRLVPRVPPSRPSMADPPAGSGGVLYCEPGCACDTAEELR